MKRKYIQPAAKSIEIPGNLMQEIPIGSDTRTEAKANGDVITEDEDDEEPVKSPQWSID